MKILICICTLVMAVMFAVNPAVAASDDGVAYPEKPINLIVNFGAGSTTDIVSRLLSKRAEKVLGGTIVVSNQSGAGGVVGISAVVRSDPDGYTIGTANMPALAIVPHLRSVPYNPETDIVQIASVLPYEYMIVANANAPYDTWKEFVHYAKKHGGITYGGLGVGTTDYLALKRINQKLDLQLRYVPFSGSDTMVAALLGNHIDVINSTAGPVASAIKAGKLKPLLITSENPLPDLAPGVPTMTAVGFDRAQVSYMSIIAPAGIPASVRQKLEAAFKIADEDPKVLATTKRLNLHPRFISGTKYEALLRSLSKHVVPLLDKLGLTKDD